MTDSNIPSRIRRRVWPGSRRVLDTLSGAGPDRPAATTDRGPGPGTGHGDGSGQPPADVIAHLVIALSRYLRQLRADSGRIPTQLEDLTACLAACIRLRRDMPVHDQLRSAFDPSAIPRRLLITKSEAAEQLGVSLRTIERLISAGQLPLVHVEGAARVRVADLEAYVQGLDADPRTTPSPAEEA
jgi:excisionase family DNA binding protein